MLFFLTLTFGIYLVFIIFIISGLFKHNILEISSSDKLPKVSVIIAARNEEENLPLLIQDIINQEYPLDKIETIIVNDRSTDLTSEIIKEASEQSGRSLVPQLSQTIEFSDLITNFNPVALIPWEEEKEESISSILSDLNRNQVMKGSSIDIIIGPPIRNNSFASILCFSII